MQFARDARLRGAWGRGVGVGGQAGVVIGGTVDAVGFAEQQIGAGGVQIRVPKLELGEGDTIAAFEQATIVARDDGVVFVAVGCCSCGVVLINLDCAVLVRLEG